MDIMSLLEKIHFEMVPGDSFLRKAMELLVTEKEVEQFYHEYLGFWFQIFRDTDKLDVNTIDRYPGDIVREKVKYDITMQLANSPTFTNGLMEAIWRELIK